MREFPDITTSRLRLRALVHADAVAVQRLAGDRRIADTTLHVPHPYPDGVAEMWIASREVAWQMETGLALAITRRATGELIGAIGLSLEAPERAAELGYWMGVPWWKQGYATEAVRAIVDYSFSYFGLDRVHAHHFARNPASGRVLEKAGFEFEGIRIAAVEKWGRPEDVRFYGLTRADWTRRRPESERGRAGK